MLKSFLTRCFAALLALAFCLCLFGCGAEEQNEGKDETPFDAEAAFPRLLNEVKYESELMDESDLASILFDLPEGTEARFYSAGGISEDALIMLKAPNAESEAALNEAIDGYLAERLYEAERYAPEQVQKLKSPARYSGGGIVILCITDDDETAKGMLAGN